MQTAINLFTLRDIGEPLPAVLERVAGSDFDGVEFIHRLPKADLDAVVSTLAETGLAVPAAHLAPFTELDGVPERFEETVDAFDAVGCGSLAVSIDEPHFESAESIRETARKLNILADLVGERGFELLYHNHYWEFDDVDGRTGFDRLLAETDDCIGVELDVGWTVAGGADVSATTERLGDRLRILHVKDADVDTRTSVEVGEGDVDLAACVDVAKAVGVDWFVYEHDEPVDPLGSLAHGASFLSDFD